jgi:hypothetical protein
MVQTSSTTYYSKEVNKKEPFRLNHKSFKLSAKDG